MLTRVDAVMDADVRRQSLIQGRVFIEASGTVCLTFEPFFKTALLKYNSHSINSPI